MVASVKQEGAISSPPVDATGAARAMLERAFPQAGQQAQVEQTSAQGVAQNTAAPVVNGQPVYSDIALADYMAKRAARQKFGDVQQTPVGLQETMHAQDMSAQLDAMSEENVVASEKNDGIISENKLTDHQNKEVQELTYNPTSGIKIKTIPGKTTTVLGRYGSDTKFIIKELNLGKSTDFSGNPGGFNLLNTPDDCYISPEQFWETYNKPFIDKAIERGDQILMATPVTYDNLYLPGTTKLTGYGREYFYLLDKGYIYENGRMILKMR